jgi:hypothetical protein
MEEIETLKQDSLNFEASQYQNTLFLMKSFGLSKSKGRLKE